jgi:hypothetical protein
LYVDGKNRLQSTPFAVDQLRIFVRRDGREDVAGLSLAEQGPLERGLVLEMYDLFYLIIIDVNWRPADTGKFGRIAPR